MRLIQYRKISYLFAFNPLSFSYNSEIAQSCTWGISLQYAAYSIVIQQWNMPYPLRDAAYFTVIQWSILHWIKMEYAISSGVARAFPGGRVAHPERQNEEENKLSLRKNKKTWSKFEERMRKVELLPTWNCEAGYGPGCIPIKMPHIRDHTISLLYHNTQKSLAMCQTGSVRPWWVVPYSEN